MNGWPASSPWRLKRLSDGANGHTLNHRQAISVDGRYAYFDARNADPEIISTDRIGRMEIESGGIEWVYRVANPNSYGPGVGAVACDPSSGRLIFIHGLHNCDSTRPYGVTRRFGAILDLQVNPASVEHAEARILSTSCPWGALRGGTHAHSWSADGRAISFTYNDEWIHEQHRRGAGPPDARTVGVMIRDFSMDIGVNEDEQFSGRCWSMLVAAVTNGPAPGTDAIESAREECFLGASNHAMAMIGRVRGENGDPIDEVFVARWPGRTEIPSGLAATDSAGRLLPPDWVELQRLTHTEHRRYPGISGPRCWLIAAPDGRLIYAPMRDELGVVQVMEISVESGDVVPVTDLDSPLESPLALNAQGNRLSLMSNGRVGILDLRSRRLDWSPCLRDLIDVPWGAFHFLPQGRGLLFHAFDKKSTPKWQQIWTLTLH